MQKSRVLSLIFHVVLCLVMLPLALSLAMGCGGKEEGPGGVSSPAASATPQDRSRPVGLDPLAEGLPPAQDVLRYMPDAAQIAVAIPPTAPLQEALLALAERFEPEAGKTEADYQQWIAELGEQLHLENAGSLAEVAAAVGVDLNKHSGVFLGFSRMAEEAKAMEVPEALDDSDESAAGEDSGDEMRVAFEAEPDFLLVLGLADKETALTRIAEVVKEDPKLAGKTPETIKERDFDLVVYDPEVFGYFIAGDRIFLGNRLDLLKSAVASLYTPSSSAYGSPECPASPSDTLVALVYPERFLPYLDALPSLIEGAGPALPILQAEMVRLQSEGSTEGVDDPVVITLAMDQERVELTSRVDLTKHVAWTKDLGKAEPLRLAPLLPENTLAMLSLRFSPEAKAKLRSMVTDGVPPELQNDPSVAPNLGIASQVLDMLGDELTIGITGLQDDFPEVYLLVGLSNPEGTKAVLSLFVPSSVTETYKEIEIRNVEVSPLPLVFAYAGDSLLAGSSPEHVKRMIDMLNEGTQSGLFAKLDPPLDPAVPRYNSLVLNTRLISEAILPLAPFWGGMDSDVQTGAGAVAEGLRELRMLSEVKGDWKESRLSFYLHPAQAAVAAPE